MPIDIIKLTSTIRGINDNLRKLRILAENPSDVFKSDFIIHNAALRLLQISIEGCISIANHIISRKNLPLPNDYADAFDILEKHNITGNSIGLKKMIRFRNRIVHVYWDIDLEFVYSLIKNGLSDVDNYISEIQRFIENDKG